MKITHVTARHLRTPADNPLVVGLPPPTDTREFALLELGTDQGLVGIGLSFFGGALTATLRTAVADLRDNGAQIIGIVLWAADAPSLDPPWIFESWFASDRAANEAKLARADR